MVRAILDGRKTQTRRVIAKQPIDILPCKEDWAGKRWVSLDTREPKPSGTIFGCKYGVPGDRLWVRETHAIVPESAYRNSDGIEQTINPSDRYEAAVYREGFDRSHSFRWRPSIHMPRWSSRITLEIINVRAERLKRISNKDAHAEGVQEWDGDQPNDYIGSFCNLWDSINEARGFGWGANPWVWVIEFKRVA